MQGTAVSPEGPRRPAVPRPWSTATGPKGKTHLQQRADVTARHHVVRKRTTKVRSSPLRLHARLMRPGRGDPLLAQPVGAALAKVSAKMRGHRCRPPRSRRPEPASSSRMRSASCRIALSTSVTGSPRRRPRQIVRIKLFSPGLRVIALITNASASPTPPAPDTVGQCRECGDRTDHGRPSACVAANNHSGPPDSPPRQHRVRKTASVSVFMAVEMRRPRGWVHHGRPQSARMRT
jgi:hypothetical protein